MSGAIVAMGGGGFSEEPDNPLLDRFALSLARHERPRVCFLATASGDADGYVARFYRAFAEHDCRPADLGLFDRRANGSAGRCRCTLVGFVAHTATNPTSVASGSGYTPRTSAGAGTPSPR